MLREDSPTSSYRLFLLLERARPDLTQDDRYDKFNKKAVASSGKGEPFQRASGKGQWNVPSNKNYLSSVLNVREFSKD